MLNKDHKKIAREKKKRRALCREMQVRGFVIYLIALFWDYIATKMLLYHNPGISTGQIILAFYGLGLVFYAEKNK